MDSWDIEAFDLKAYLDSLGLKVQEPSAEYLADIYERHVETYPFTSLNVLLGPHPGVEPTTAFDQLVTKRRGGYCLEHTQILAGVLEQLGFSVERHLGRVYDSEGTRSHMTLFATVDGETYLCDPGFGFTIRRPLPLRDGASVNQGGRVFSLERKNDQWWLYRDETPQHIIDDLPVLPIDIASSHSYLQNDFGPFHSQLMALKFTEQGHVTITAKRKTIRNDDAPTEVHELAPDQVVAELKDMGLNIDEAKEERLMDWLKNKK